LKNKNRKEENTMAQERKSAVTLHGNPFTLIGPVLKEGDPAPDFKCAKGLGETVTLDTYGGKAKVFNVIVSVDTPVCDKQTRKFNEEASKLPSDVSIVTFSMDLPFALGRYCGASGIDNVETISDHMYASFGENYGVLIKENRLLARAIFVVDKDNRIRHAEYVDELSNEPDYDKALKVLNEII